MPASIPLPPYGTIGIDPTFMVQLPTVIVPQPGGMKSVSITIPNWPGWIGIPINAQAVMFQYPLQPVLTNVILGIVQ